MKMVQKAVTLKRWMNGFLASLLVTSTALTPAYASDTEVYSRVVDFSGDVTPVLMMVLDSSGSMLFCMNGEESCEYPKVKRIDMLRNSMRKVLFGSPTGTVVKPAPEFMKMGYTRFNPDANDGGWTRYPALKLSSTIPDSWMTTATLDARVKSSASDAVGINLTGSNYLMGSDTIGVRFEDLQIPRNATVTGAFMTFFRPDTSGSVPSRVEIKREQTTNAAAYSVTNDPGSLLRSYTSGSQVAVAEPTSQSWLVGVVTMDVTDMVQDQVKQAAWCGGNAMAFLLSKGSGQTRSFNVLSYDGAVGAATDARPSLTVTYTISGSDRSSSCINAPIDVVASVKSTLDDVEWMETADASVSYREPLLQPGAVPDAVRNQVGLRFGSVEVLPGATIDKAWLYVTQAQSAATNAATVEVAAMAADNAAPFCTQDSTTKVVTCTVPSTASLSTTASLALPASAVDGVHAAIDVTTQVSEVVSRAGWASGNAMAFVLRNSSAAAASSETSLYAVDGGLSKGAVLHVVMRKQYTDLDKIDKSVRQDLMDEMNTRMYAEGGTPLGDAYAEAARYMLGMSAYSTDTFTTTFTGQAPSQTYRQPDSRTTTTPTGNTYQSPLEETGECSANYLFMMSDGVPNNASNVNNNSGGITGGYNPDCNAYSKMPVSTGNAQANFACMASVATHLASANNQKKALIRTNSVLFDDDPAMTSETVKDMALVAKAGKGAFFHAKNENQLTDALLNTLTTLLDETGSITAPGVAVNQFNRLTHLDQLYYAVFDPDTGKSRWRGNVKRYRLNFSTTGASIVDKNNAEAIDPATTFFSTNAHSFWSPTKDGNTAVLGGVSSVLPRPESRTIYTYMPAYTSNMTLGSLNAVAAATGRAAVTGLTVDEQFNNLRKWLYGYSIDVVDTSVTPKIIKKTAISVSTTTQTRNEVGGVLHSQPVLVNYGYTGTDPAAAQTDPTKQDNMVFFSTMEGMLHVANANTGIEKFAFIPKETLSRAAIVALNDSQPLPEFGLDVTWSVYRVDSNADLKIVQSDGDKIWLFGGMRMGGSNYYALDVTNRDSPKLKWVIQGGTGSGSFGNMGQTWSKPSIGQIKVGGVVKTVLFIGGGYDPKHENAGFNSVTNASDAKGNQVYVVDADTGSLLWSASSSGSPSLTVPNLMFSVPSELKLFDANKDGLVDAVYFGDLGGQVFRLDINNAATNNAGIGVRVKRLANLGQRITANTVNQRRFYEAPGVAMMFDAEAGVPYVAVAIGSGYRSHPLDLQTEDAFYVLRDNDVLRSDLVSATDLEIRIEPDDLAVVDLGSPAGANLDEKRGWMIELPASGEKVLSTPLILFGEVFFTTYIPNLASEGKCKPVIGASSLWRVSATDGAASFDFNKDGSVTTADRSQEGMVQGLGGAPQLLIGDDGKNAVITGTGVERNKDLEKPTMRRTRWYEKAK